MKCKRCGRPIRKESSVLRGYGATCATKEIVERKARAIRFLEDRISVLTMVNPQDHVARQMAKAIEVIEDGAVQKTWNPTVFRVRSEDGLRNYLASTNGNCTCAHGIHRFRAMNKNRVDICYHVGVARVIVRYGVLL